MLLFYTCMLCYLHRVRRLQNAPSALAIARFFWLDRPRKLRGFALILRVALDERRHRSINYWSPSAGDGRRWRTQLLAWHTHVHGSSENALLTLSNIYKVFDSRITSQVYPLLSDYISSLICTSKHIRYTPPPHFPKISVTNFSRFVCIYTLKHIYSLRPIILFVNTDVSRHILVIDTFVFAKSNMGRRE
jgi:hypothetical protein